MSVFESFAKTKKSIGKFVTADCGNTTGAHAPELNSYLRGKTSQPTSHAVFHCTENRVTRTYLRPPCDGNVLHCDNSFPGTVVRSLLQGADVCIRLRSCFGYGFRISWDGILYESLRWTILTVSSYVQMTDLRAYLGGWLLGPLHETHKAHICINSRANIEKSETTDSIWNTKQFSEVRKQFKNRHFNVIRSKAIHTSFSAVLQPLKTNFFQQNVQIQPALFILIRISSAKSKSNKFQFMYAYLPSVNSFTFLRPKRCLQHFVFKPSTATYEYGLLLRAHTHAFCNVVDRHVGVWLKPELTEYFIHHLSDLPKQNLAPATFAFQFFI